MCQLPRRRPQRRGRSRGRKGWRTCSRSTLWPSFEADLGSLWVGNEHVRGTGRQLNVEDGRQRQRRNEHKRTEIEIRYETYVHTSPSGVRQSVLSFDVEIVTSYQAFPFSRMGQRSVVELLCRRICVIVIVAARVALAFPWCVLSPLPSLPALVSKTFTFVYPQLKK